MPNRVHSRCPSWCELIFVAVDETSNPAVADPCFANFTREISCQCSRRWQKMFCKSFGVFNKLYFLQRVEFQLINVLGLPVHLNALMMLRQS